MPRALTLHNFPLTVRLLVARHVAWVVLEAAIGLFGALFLIRSGGGLLTVGLWSLWLGPAIAVVFLLGASVFPRLGTRPFMFLAVGGMLATALTLAFGADPTSVLSVALLGLARTAAVGAYWSAFLLAEWDEVPAAMRPRYFTSLSQFALAATTLTPLAAGLLVQLFPGGPRAGFTALFLVASLCGLAVLALSLRLPSTRTPREGAYDLRRAFTSPGFAWAATGTAFRGFADLGALAGLAALMLASILGNEALIGAQQAAQSAATVVGIGLAATLISRFGPSRGFVWGPLALVAGNLVIVLAWDPLVLWALIPFFAVAGPLWGNSVLLVNQELIDRDPEAEHHRYVYLLARELMLSAARTVSALVILGAALLWGDGALRPLFGGFLVAFLAAGYCFRQAHRPANLVPSAARRRLLRVIPLPRRANEASEPPDPQNVTNEAA